MIEPFKKLEENNKRAKCACCGKEYDSNQTARMIQHVTENQQCYNFLKTNKDKKVYRAVITYPSPEYPYYKKYESTACKQGGRWIVSGDYPNAITDAGGKIFIETKTGIHLLKGCRLIFQDGIGLSEMVTT